MKKIAILGSTGSIGTQALEVIQENRNSFCVEVLTANNNSELLIQQAKEFLPNAVVIANEDKYSQVRQALENLPIKVFAGKKALAQIVDNSEIDVILAGMVGYAGLLPVINAIKAKKAIALANKETLVVAGDLITRLAFEYGTPIYPVDSEHSAIFQCLVGEETNAIEKIYLTASGGPFRTLNVEQIKHVTRAQALKHPNWAMGAKITIDSASMMNKGLETIEAKWLFNLKPSQIDVVIHPQSIIHSLVQFEDGALKAQLGLPDMKLPIQYALSFPQRLKTNFKRFSFIDFPDFSFEKPDLQKFRNLAIALHALEKGGNIPCIMNAANEVVVDAFLHDNIGFWQMSDVIEKAIQKFAFAENLTYEQYVETDSEVRKYTAMEMKNMSNKN